MEYRKTAVLIGAGSAWLTTALGLLRKTGITPIVLEKSPKGNRIDIGGHRLFSNSDPVMR